MLASGIAGALSGAIPLFSFVFAAVLLRSERITPLRTIGVLIGFGGRPTYHEAVGHLRLRGHDRCCLHAAWLGQRGVSFVYARRFLNGLSIDPAALTTYQIGIAFLMLAAVTDYQGITSIGDDRRALIGLVVGLGILGTGVAYILYYFIVERLGDHSVQRHLCPARRRSHHRMVPCGGTGPPHRPGGDHAYPRRCGIVADQMKARARRGQCAFGDLYRTGHDATRICPTDRGRAPGWHAGLVLAARKEQLVTETQPAPHDPCVTDAVGV